MNRTLRAVAAVMLMMVFSVGCQKPGEPDNEEDNGSQQAFVVPHNGGGDTIACEYVDLGLPSGTLWAACNVGANRPEEFGDYFAWGETAPKDYYSWSNYAYGDTINGHFAMNKYCTDSGWGFHGFVDSLTVLQRADDAARVNWGADWRMPTKEEMEELYQNTTFTWTALNGVEGRLMTGPNGNSIFLPASGFYLDNEVICPGLGIYWSNTLHSGFPERGWSFHFDYEECHVCGTYERCRGQVVRAVRSSN